MAKVVLSEKDLIKALNDDKKNRKNNIYFMPSSSKTKVKFNKKRGLLDDLELYDSTNGLKGLNGTYIINGERIII